MLIGRLQRGTIRRGQTVVRIAHDGEHHAGKVNQLFVFSGLDRREVEQACGRRHRRDRGHQRSDDRRYDRRRAAARALPVIAVEEPTVRMTFSVNTSPFAGREGTYVTSRKLRERLYQELERDVALRVADTDTPTVYRSAGAASCT